MVNCASCLSDASFLMKTTSIHFIQGLRYPRCFGSRPRFKGSFCRGVGPAIWAAEIDRARRWPCTTPPTPRWQRPSWSEACRGVLAVFWVGGLGKDAAGVIIWIVSTGCQTGRMLIMPELS